MAIEPEMRRQRSLAELRHPVPLSFEPVKSFFKSLREAMQSTFQKPLDARLKESESACDQLWLFNSTHALWPRRLSP
jgi:hypothetical protein